MDKAEAYSLINEELEKYQNMQYSELLLFINKPQTNEILSPSNKSYQTEVQVMWDDKENENIRVIASIDDMKWYAFSPISESIIMRPDGSVL